MDIVTWVILGLIVGILAKFIMPGRDGGGLIKTILVGIGGAFLGGYLSQHFGFGGQISGINLVSVVTATAGALLLLFLFKFIPGV